MEIYFFLYFFLCLSGPSSTKEKLVDQSTVRIIRSVTTEGSNSLNVLISSTIHSSSTDGTTRLGTVLAQRHLTTDGVTESLPDTPDVTLVNSDKFTSTNGQMVSNIANDMKGEQSDQNFITTEDTGELTPSTRFIISDKIKQNTPVTHMSTDQNTLYTSTIKDENMFVTTLEEGWYACLA